MKKFISTLVMGIGLFFLSCTDLAKIVSGSDPNAPDGNDNIGNATPYTLEQATQFAINLTGDIDYFKFSVNKPALYFINIGNIPSSISPWIEVLDNEGTLVNSYYPWSDLTSVSFGLQLKAGNYYAKLHAGSDQSSTQQMTFSINRDLVDTFEINGSLSTASPIRVSTFYRATTFPSNDYDYFSFTLDSNMITKIQLDSISSKIDVLCLELLDIEGTLIKYQSGYSNSPIEYVRSLNKGTYFLKTYSLYNLTSSLKPHRLFICKDTTDLTEWNDDTIHAVALAYGQTVQAAIYPDKDVDYFKFTVDAVDSIIIKADSISSLLTDFKVRIIQNNSVIATSALYPSGSLSYKQKLNPGMYYLQVYSQYNSISEYSSKRYYLTINK